ncbi:MAG: hypothetical protein PUB25_00960 [Lachnospiraceae bacterium]|nr:hypothetical protein [Lachnospiraceae bacterium]
MLWNYKSGNVTYDKMLLATFAMMGSFGPVVALSNLSNNLTQTLASGERVLSLLEEEPQIVEINGKESTTFEGAVAEQVNFAYEEEEILQNYSIEIPKGNLSGKSTYMDKVIVTRKIKAENQSFQLKIINAGDGT